MPLPVEIYHYFHVHRANSVEDAVRRGQRQVEQVKLKISLQMDDRTFQACLLETQVMLTKDHTKWHFDTLQELVDGPLLNAKRMEEAIKGSRFIRRIMSFFNPFSHRFSDLLRTKVWHPVNLFLLYQLTSTQPNTKWVRLGNSLLITLMASSEGVKYLQTEDQFLTQIVKSFAQLDPVCAFLRLLLAEFLNCAQFNGVPDSDPIFSKKRVAETLTYGYLEMLGTLSRYKEGIE
jgi:rapamycin-insensitive companion of mTOR